MRQVAFMPDGIRRRCTPRELIAAWRATGTTIPAQYACGTAQHESDFTLNEVDTEESGFVTKGVYQLSDNEARSVTLPNADLLTLVDATAVMVKITERNADGVCNAAGICGYTDDVLAYLHIAHNQGLSAAVKSIKRHGLDWSAYKTRNVAMAIEAVQRAPHLKSVAEAEAKLKWWRKVCAYGDSCISGGHSWPGDANG